LRRISSGDIFRDAGGNGRQRRPISRNETVQPASLEQLQYYSLAIMGSLVGYLVPAAFISFTYYSHFWLLIALAVAVSEVAKKATRHLNGSSRPGLHATNWGDRRDEASNSQKSLSHLAWPER